VQIGRGVVDGGGDIIITFTLVAHVFLSS